MKLVIMFFLSLFLGKSCSSQAQKDTENIVLEYTASTRGFYQKITIQNKKFSISKDRNAKETTVFNEISDKDWEELVRLFKAVDLDSLATLVAPTDKRFYDGAAAAKLKVVYKEKTYQSTAFDHGNAPKEIKEIVDKIDSFAKRE